MSLQSFIVVILHINEYDGYGRFLKEDRMPIREMDETSMRITKIIRLYIMTQVVIWDNQMEQKMGNMKHYKEKIYQKNSEMDFLYQRKRI